MSSAAQPLPASLPAAPLVAVTDGRDEALPAVRAAAVLAARLDAPVQAVATVEPLPGVGLDSAAAAARDAVRRQVRQATRGAPPAESDWPARVAVGRPAPTIAALAAEWRAELVVVSGGAPRWGERSGGTEAALVVARTGAAPVLAVGPEADGTLRRAVVAMDFSPPSLRAAALASRLLAPGGTLSLVHVRPRPEPGDTEWEAWDSARDRKIGDLFQRLVVALRGAAPLASAVGRRDVTIGTATLVGDPADELVEYAARVGADLLAVGTHGGGERERLFVGSVAEGVVRRAGAELRECSVLVTPADGPRGA